MNIDRSHITEALRKRVLEGPCLVLGQPGIGKSSTVWDLVKRCDAEGRRARIIPIDQVHFESDDDLRRVCGLEEDWTNQLLHEARHDKKLPALLIFDAFDAARGEKKREKFLSLIVQAMHGLAGKWNVIVTVRSFDASKSPSLRRLFSDAGGQVRQLDIPQLTDEELQQAFDQVPKLREVWNAGSAEFQTLCRVPFNLWLVDQILENDDNVAQFSNLQSEVQLLRLYWEHRISGTIDGDIKEDILRDVVRAMVRDHSLSASKDTVYDRNCDPQWTSILSSEVLKSDPDSKNHIRFSHNILFDYAASRLLCDDSPQRISDFIREDPARVLFLRPSLVYHFTGLWYQQRRGYWENLFSALAGNESHMHQVVRLILPSVLSRETLDISDLEPLFELLDGHEKRGINGTSYLLQAIQMLDPRRDELWMEVLCRISKNLDAIFAWNVGILTDVMLKRAEQSGETNIASKAGLVARNLLSWLWAEKTQNPTGWNARLAAILGIPLVSRTFATSPTKSRELLEPVLGLMQEPGFPVDCVYRLCENLPIISKTDPEMAVAIYERVFGHFESSEEKTHMGGYVLPMISNRRQDYEMCHYLLGRAFPAFIKKHPRHATLAAIKALNVFICATHVMPHSQDDGPPENRIKRFAFLGKEAAFLEDYSYIWGQSAYPEQPLKIADVLFSHVQYLAREKKLNDLAELLSVFAEHALVAYFWKRLLECASQVPEGFAQVLFPLATLRTFQTSPDVLHALGLFIGAAAPYLQQSQLAQLERSLLSLREDADKKKADFFAHCRDRLLMCIPQNRLQTKEGKALALALKSREKPPVNEPLVHFDSSWKSYTEEESLKDQGVDILDPQNKELVDLVIKFDLFEREWQNKPIPVEALREMLPFAQRLQHHVRSGHGNDALLRSSWRKLSSFANAYISHVDSPEADESAFFEAVVLEAAENREPEPDPERDANWKSASWSPLPRNEAAQTLPKLALKSPKKEILDSIRRLASDTVPSVRFLVAIELWRLRDAHSDLVMELLADRIEKETNATVLEGLALSLTNVLSGKLPSTLELLTKMYGRVLRDDEDASYHDDVILMVTDRVIHSDDVWAREAISEIQAAPNKRAQWLAYSARRTLQYLDPLNQNPSFDKALAIHLVSIRAATKGLLRVHQEVQDEGQSQEIIKILYTIVDNTVARLYFAADLDEGLRKKDETPVIDTDRRKFYQKIRVILDEIISFAENPEGGLLFAPTAHHFMELLSGVLKYDVRGVLNYAHRIAKASKPYGYSLDSFAVKEVVKIVETILADHRAEVQSDSSMKDLLGLLDIFAEVGWPEALRLVWKLDEVYR